MLGWHKGWIKPAHNKGQVGIIRTHGLSSWVIRMFTRSHVNHMVIDVGDGLVSAEYPHVIKRDYGHFTNIIWSRFEYTPAQITKITDFANTQLGKNYGWADDIAIGIGLLTRQHTPHWLMRWLSNNGEWICSSLADASLRHAGIHLWDDDRPVGAVYPGSFENWFRDAGWLPKRILFSRRQP
jgi:hypothetical protein